MVENDDLAHHVPAPLEADPLGTDAALLDALQRHGAEGHLPRLRELSRTVGSPRTARWVEFADRYTPVLRTHDPDGRRVDEIEYHPGWHRLVNAGVRAGLTAAPWDPAAPPGAHTARAGGLMLFSQAGTAHTSALTSTFAVVPALKADPTLEKTWLPRLASRAYESALRRADDKLGCLAGLALTETHLAADPADPDDAPGLAAHAVRIGGSAPVEGDAVYRLNGHKWFVSSPMSDVLLVSAATSGGPTLFLVPRVLTDGRRNPVRLQRLKHKLGQRAGATAEVEFEAAWAVRLGDESDAPALLRGVVAAVRHDAAIGAAGLMRSAVVRAVHHTRRRTVGDDALADLPLMQNVLADLAVESEAATALTMRMAAAVDAGDAELVAILVPMTRYWVAQRAVTVAGAALECLGGNGFVEENGIARLVRDAPGHILWQGGGNTDALAVLRTLVREPGTLDAVLAELQAARGVDPRLDKAIDAVAAFLDAAIREGRRDLGAVEGGARWMTERLAVVLQAALLADTAPTPVLSAFLATRIAGGGGQQFGTLPVGRRTTQAVVERAVPE